MNKKAINLSISRSSIHSLVAAHSLHLHWCQRMPLTVWYSQNPAATAYYCRTSARSQNTRNSCKAHLPKEMPGDHTCINIVTWKCINQWHKCHKFAIFSTLLHANPNQHKQWITTLKFKRSLIYQHFHTSTVSSFKFIPLFLVFLSTVFNCAVLLWNNYKSIIACLVDPCHLVPVHIADLDDIVTTNKRNKINTEQSTYVGFKASRFHKYF